MWAFRVGGSARQFLGGVARQGVRNLVPKHRRKQVLIAIQQLYEAWFPLRHTPISTGCLLELLLISLIASARPG